ncbi:hypothetical protein CEXT_526811 [Caerostris extrusa]|uniref:Uncharacterized protein n=1 Tax=Caerostris extrusa TaxID=172846 RepID=A0AAV4QGY5_CAEEX|nr:hypothetical protein CEXT_526811 [Caerostris extrusa]
MIRNPVYMNTDNHRRYLPLASTTKCMDVFIAAPIAPIGGALIDIPNNHRCVGERKQIRHKYPFATPIFMAVVAEVMDCYSQKRRILTLWM